MLLQRRHRARIRRYYVISQLFESESEDDALSWEDENEDNFISDCESSSDEEMILYFYERLGYIVDNILPPLKNT